MRTWPVIEHHLRVAVWRREAWAPRRSAVLWAMGALLLFYLLPEWVGRTVAPPGASSMVLFILMLYCLIAGAHQTVDALSAEKREETLPLVFLAGLTGFQIVVAKLVKLGWRPLCALLAFLPFFSIELLAGQLQPGQVLRGVPALLNVLFFSLAAGLFASSLARSSRMGGLLATLVVLGATIGLPVAGFLLGRLLPGIPVMHVFTLASPFGQIALATEPAGEMRAEFIGSLLILQATAWGLLALGGWILGRSWQERPARPARLSWKERWRQWSYGRGAARAERRRRLLSANPFYWLAARNRLDPLWVWAFLGTSVAVAVWLMAGQETAEGRVWAAILLFTLCSAVTKYWLAGAAAARLWMERNSGALEFLLSTPLTEPEIVRGQWLALRRQFAGPVAALIAGGVATTLWLWRLPPDLTWQPPADDFVLWAGLAVVVVFLADLPALVWGGMFEAMKERSQKHASSSVFRRIVLGPNLVFALYLFVDMTVRTAAILSIPPPIFYLAIWFAVRLASSLIEWRRFRGKLLGRMRPLAVARC